MVGKPIPFYFFCHNVHRNLLCFYKMYPDIKEGVFMNNSLFTPKGSAYSTFYILSLPASQNVNGRFRTRSRLFPKMELLAVTPRSDKVYL